MSIRNFEILYGPYRRSTPWSYRNLRASKSVISPRELLLVRLPIARYDAAVRSTLLLTGWLVCESLHARKFFACEEFERGAAARRNM